MQSSKSLRFFPALLALLLPAVAKGSPADDQLLAALKAYDSKKAIALVPAADPQYVDARGKGWLHLVAENYPDERVYEALLRNGADVNGQDKFGETPLLAILARNASTAGAERIPAVVRVLLAHGADVNKRSSNESPVERCIGHKNPQALRDILATGKVDVGAKNPFGRTIAESFVDSGCGDRTSGELVDALVAAGVDFRAKNANGRSARELAERRPACKPLVARMTPKKR